MSHNGAAILADAMGEPSMYLKMCVGDEGYVDEISLGFGLETAGTYKWQCVGKFHRPRQVLG